MQYKLPMFTYAKKPLFIISLSLSLVACGGFKANDTQNWRPQTFTHSQDNNEPLSIQVRGQNFKGLKTRNSDFLSLPNTELSKNLKGAKFENQVFEVRINNEKIFFDLEPQRGLRFNALNETGRYSIKGHCLEKNCAQANIILEDIEASEVVEILYSRSTEYLTTSSLDKLGGSHQELVLEAIEYRFPVYRHTIRINNSRDLDILVIERPQADGVSEDFSDIDTSESKVVFDDGTVPFIEKKSARNENQRVELSAEQSIRFDASPVTSNAQQKIRLTPNLIDAYDLLLPHSFFKAGEGIRYTGQLENHIEIVPIHEQKEFEPVVKMAVIAKAFKEQGVKIYENACNFYVRAVLSLAGYTQGGHGVPSNKFHQVFQKNTQGLQQWEERTYSFNNASDLNRLKKDLSSIPQAHAVVAQVDRTSIGRRGHTGILVVENDQLVIYDSSLNDFGPRRTVVRAENLLNQRRPVLKLHSYPNLIRP